MTLTTTMRNVQTPGKAKHGGSTQLDNCEALDKSSVAELSVTLIAEMNCEELCRVIRAAELPTLGGIDIDGRLTFYDRPTLARLAHLARRCCQTQRHSDPLRDGSY